MKVKSAVRRLCHYCYMYRKESNRKLYVKCIVNPRHKQRQLFSMALEGRAFFPPQQDWRLSL
jgi:ribosomal protein L36